MHALSTGEYFENKAKYFVVFINSFKVTAVEFSHKATQNNILILTENHHQLKNLNSSKISCLTVHEIKKSYVIEVKVIVFLKFSHQMSGN